MTLQGWGASCSPSRTLGSTYCTVLNTIWKTFQQALEGPILSEWWKEVALRRGLFLFFILETTRTTENNPFYNTIKFHYFEELRKPFNQNNPLSALWFCKCVSGREFFSRESFRPEKKNASFSLFRPRFTAFPKNRGPNAHPISRNTKKHRVYTNLLKSWRELSLVPYDMSQKPSRNRSENLFRWTFLFGVDFEGLAFPHLKQRRRAFVQTGATRFTQYGATRIVSHKPDI